MFKQTNTIISAVKFTLFLVLISIQIEAISQVELGRIYIGKATYYAKKFYGRKTSSGEILKSTSLTIAHKFLPFGTMVEIENLSNKKWVVARVNDRGPFAAGALIDLTDAVKNKIGMVGNSQISMMIVGDAGQVYLGRVDVTQNTNQIIKNISDDTLNAKIPTKNLKAKKGYSKKRKKKSKNKRK